MQFQGKEVLNWSINDYLGLATHPEVLKADADAAAQFGLATPMGARMMSGNSNYHEQLEAELAEFVMKEDAILLNFGYQGMSSTIECTRGWATNEPARLRRLTRPALLKAESALFTVIRAQP